MCEAQDPDGRPRTACRPSAHRRYGLIAKKRSHFRRQIDFGVTQAPIGAETTRGVVDALIAGGLWKGVGIAIRNRGSASLSSRQTLKIGIFAHASPNMRQPPLQKTILFGA
jgi:hypothetical protein